MISTLDSRLTGHLKEAFAEVLDSRFISILQSNLEPLQTDISTIGQAREEQDSTIMRELQHSFQMTEPLLGEFSSHKDVMSQQFKAIISKLEEHKVSLVEEFATLRIGISGDREEQLRTAHKCSGCFKSSISSSSPSLSLSPCSKMNAQSAPNPVVDAPRNEGHHHREALKEL